MIEFHLLLHILAETWENWNWETYMFDINNNNNFQGHACMQQECVGQYINHLTQAGKDMTYSSFGFLSFFKKAIFD